MDTYIKARASTDAKLEDLDNHIDEVITQLRDKSRILFKKQSLLEARQQTLLETNGGSTAFPKDELTLNVGGTQVIVLRETLTQISGSRLETLFSGRWDNRLIRDEKDRIFLDVNPYCFKKIVTYLRLLKISKHPKTNPPKLTDVSDEYKESFNRLLDFFGLETNNGSLHLKASDTSYDSATDTTGVTVSDEVLTGTNDNGSYLQQSKVSNKVSIQDTEKCYHALLTSMKDEEKALMFAETKLQVFEKKIASEESFFSFFTKSDANDVVVNIKMDGNRVSVKRSTMCLCKESRLAKMFEENINIKLGNNTIVHDSFDSSNGDCDVFIDQPADLFLMLIDQLRLRAISDEGDVISYPYMKCDMDMDNFRRIVSYYFQDHEDFILPTKLKQSDSDIISVDQDEKGLIPITKQKQLKSDIISVDEGELIRAWLKEAKKSDQPELLYRASRDGWKGSDFHGKCDGKGPTLTLIKSSGGFTFGGYLGSSWHSRGCYISCKDAFLFTLHSHVGLPPTKLSVKRSSKAGYGHKSSLPRFGDGDIVLKENAKSKNCLNIGIGYHCPLGYTHAADGETLLTGYKKFQAGEVEVFLVK